MFIIKIHCTDKPGIVAAVANCLNDNGCNIEESSQYNDPLSGRFFMRIVFSTIAKGNEKKFKDCFEHISQKLEMTWEIFNKEEKVKAFILTSKTEHCLNDILYRWRTNHLDINITGVGSNHTVSQKLVEHHEVPFHYLPVTNSTKSEQESQISEIIKSTDTELIILARYMQIFSNEMCEKHTGQAINIHHSFLPGFKGANPYKQAYERGVKIIGATAHFVTSDLDEGPIIAQETAHIDHTHTPKKLQTIGQDNEAKTLARAIQLYAERRIFLHQGRTIIL